MILETGRKNAACRDEAKNLLKHSRQSGPKVTGSPDLDKLVRQLYRLYGTAQA